MKNQQLETDSESTYGVILSFVCSLFSTFKSRETPSSDSEKTCGAQGHGGGGKSEELYNRQLILNIKRPQLH